MKKTAVIIMNKEELKALKKSLKYVKRLEKSCLKYKKKERRK